MAISFAIVAGLHHIAFSCCMLLPTGAQQSGTASSYASGFKAHIEIMATGAAETLCGW